MDIYFVLANDDLPIPALEQLDPDRDWQAFVSTTRAWVLQTYLRLRAHRIPVQLINELPEADIAIVSAGDRHALLRNRSRRSRALIVAARGSFNSTPAFADAEIVQNQSQADDNRRFFMTHWPQPGLIPRDPARGTRIEKIAFKGFPKNLDGEFRGAEWHRFLNSHGIEWVDDAVPYDDLKTNAAALQWPDYRDIDLVVAVRPDSSDMYPNRPATKLYNSWLAGVPALLGPELAYRAIRSHPDDYLEIRNLQEAKEAIVRLLREPDRYLALQLRARERAEEFNVQRTVSRWISLLTERLPERFLKVQRRSPRALWRRQLVGRLRWAVTKKKVR